ncbi:hypothetical protein pdam_00020756 [Pocillopora damicornis]|uniref:Uncharacterized protein n=1 Tax=Pocillopora damicornis TaxID=46731 RepID=A0A3M6TAU0_POCDA|nr:hypothetical protein pdam_00020756 [Pocillopora damicornis]
MANVEQKAQQKPNSTERNKSATNLPFNSLDVNRLFRGLSPETKTNTIILLLPSPPYWRQKLAKTVALGFKMASLSEQSRVRELFDSVTFGVVRSLETEKKPGVTDFRLLDRRQAEKHIIFTWELVIFHFLNKH